MSELTNPRDYETKGITVILAIEARDNKTFYKGTMIVAGTNGYADSASDAANQIPVGVYTGRQGQELITGSAEHPKIEIESGLIGIARNGAVSSDVGKLFYLQDGGDVDTTAGTNRNFALVCKGFKFGFVLLDFASPVKVL